MEEKNKNNYQNVVIDHTPKLGIKFGYEQEAYNFYNKYVRNCGFSICKDWCNKRQIDGVMTLR
jgi:hypothetical protein